MFDELMRYANKNHYDPAYRVLYGEISLICIVLFIIIRHEPSHQKKKLRHAVGKRIGRRIL